jgi:ABC-type transport system involved in multi-copper enzyme maturation permease subunit
MPDTTETLVIPRVATPAAVMPPATRRRMAVARLEWGEVRRSRWLAFCSGLYAALAALFFLIGARESSVLAFTGMGRVLFSLSHALVVLLPLLALSGTGLVVNRGRREGGLELLFSHPVTRDDYFVAVTVVRCGTLLAPLVVLMPALALLGRLMFGQPVPWAFLVRALVVSAALLWSFAGIGLAISVGVSDSGRAAMYVLLVWVVSVALLDIGVLGVLLQWRTPAVVVFVLAGLNPVEMARLALLSGADSTLGTLGPVGFFLTDRLGSGLLFVMGVLWPLVVGTVAWWLARRAFRRGDVV